MKAWQYTKDGAPIQLNEVPQPHAAPGEIVIETKASGVCHTDVGHLDGVISYMLRTNGEPRTLGHEIAGVVHEVGEGVTHLSIGDRVAVTAALVSPAVHGRNNNPSANMRTNNLSGFGFIVNN